MLRDVLQRLEQAELKAAIDVATNDGEKQAIDKIWKENDVSWFEAVAMWLLSLPKSKGT